MSEDSIHRKTALERVSKDGNKWNSLPFYGKNQGASPHPAFREKYEKPQVIKGGGSSYALTTSKIVFID